MSSEIEMTAQEMVDWANASLDRTRELEAELQTSQEVVAGYIDEVAMLEAQIEALQNKCANRGLSPEDSDALEARVAELEAELVKQRSDFEQRILELQDESTE